MGFIFGLMLGGMAAGGGGVTLPNLGSIPFRCLSAFEVSDAAYRECRERSLSSDLMSTCDRAERSAASGGCSITQNLKWEIAGLHQLKSAIEAKASQSK